MANQTLATKALVPKDIGQLVIQQTEDAQGNPRVQIHARYRHRWESNNEPIPFGNQATQSVPLGNAAAVDIVAFISTHVIPFLNTRPIIPGDTP